MRTQSLKYTALALAFATGMATSATATAQDLSAEDAQAIAAEAYLYAYAPLYNYKTLFQQVMDPAFPGYIGGFNRFRHYSRGYTPADADIVTPSNDTPYSWAWLDLRTEPMVVSVPAAPDRYYVLQWFDLYTHNFAYIGSRATGTEAGHYLFVGPGWAGETPDGITAVLEAETEIIGTLTRTAWTGPDDRDGLVEMQQQYRIRPLSEFRGGKPPAPQPLPHFPAWDEARVNGASFIDYLNFIKRFAPTVPEEEAMFERFAALGIGAGETFDPDSLDPAIRQAIEAGIADAQQKLDDRIAQTTSSADLFGTRAYLGEDFVMRRSVGAAMGIYGNSKEEAYYTAYATDDQGKPLDGGTSYVLQFAPEQVPPVAYFWSMTMYELPSRLLVDNPIDRYAIGSRTDGLVTNDDGSIDIYLQSEQPDDDQANNWLPTPADGNFYMILRMYGPEGALVDGSWQAPQPTAVP